MHNPVDLKQQLFSLCLLYAEERITVAKQAIALAQASANEETKSSSGDKYETGRAMAQLEIENSTGQLAEAMKLKEAAQQISPDQNSQLVQLGSLVFTDQGNYYISISAGKLVVGGVTIFAVSPVSPVGARLMKLSAGSSVTLNQKTYRILEIT